MPVGRHDYSLALPLPAEQLQAVAAAAVTPVVRVAIALAAIHAARPNAIRRLHVDDIDLGNRRLTVAGRSRPLDDLTRHVLLDWLDYRRARWPDTANPHALITQQTANETGPVSPAWMARTFGGLAAPSNSSASTGSSTKPSPADRTRCTWPPCSTSTPRPRSATPTTRGSS